MSDFQEKLLRLRKNYTDSLQNRLSEIQAETKNLLSEWSQESAKTLHRLCHSLAGSGATFGFPEISKAGRQLENLLDTILSTDVTVNENQHQLIANYLKNIHEQIAASLQADVTTSTPEPNGTKDFVRPVASNNKQNRKLVFLVENNIPQSPQISNIISNAGYRVKTIHHLESLEQEIQEEQPAAIIIDIVPPEDDPGGANVIEIVNEHTNSAIPTIFISIKNDMETRLTALRAGAKYFLPKPLKDYKLINCLDEATNTDNKEPYRILIIGDDPLTADLYTNFLITAGMTVSTLNHPMEVLDVIHSFKPELILTDLYMPLCSGMELSEIIRQDRFKHNIPIIFLSAEKEANKQVPALLSEGDDFIVKPVNADHLISIVTARIERARIINNTNKKLRTALRENQTQRLALDQHAIVSTTDAEGTITYVNDKFCAASKYPRGELIGQNHRILNSGFHPEDFFDAMWSTISRGKIWQGEIRNKAKDGKHYWVESTIMPFLDEDGKPYQYISVRTDITPVKQSEIKLRKSEERLNRSQTFANIGTWDWNITTGDLFWSDRIGPLFGYGNQEIDTTYENFLAAVHPDDRRLVTESVNKCVESGAKYDIEHRIITQKGNVRWVQERGDVTRDQDGKPLHMLGVVQDITLRKQAQDALATSEQRLKEAQQLEHIGNWSWNVESGKIYWSDEIYRIFGRTPGEFEPTYERFMETVHPDDVSRIKKSEQEAFAKGEKHSIDHRIILANGEVRWVHEEAVSIVDNNNNPVSLMGTVQDITAHKNIETELVHLKEEAENANKAKSEFLSSMSHELRTPLNAILGFSQLLELDNENQLSEGQKENIEHITKSGWHLLELINEILDLSKIEAGKVGLSLENIELTDVLDECLTLIGPLADEYNIKLINNIEPHIQSSLFYVDRTRLKQIFLNLMSNAIKYNSKRGSITLTASELNNGTARIHVTDTGQGLSEEDKTHLFKPFERIGAEKSGTEGTGIGLVITKQLVELMDGNIGVESEPGKGSTFWVEFNVVTDKENNKDKEDNTRTPADKTKNGDMPQGHTILYIEDNPANLKLVEQIMEQHREDTLLSAHNAEIGLDMARTHQPDLILLDINLPDIDGYEALRQLKSMDGTKDIPVFAISANAMTTDIKKGMDAGFLEYITKPIDINEFTEKLDSALRKIHP